MAALRSRPPSPRVSTALAVCHTHLGGTLAFTGDFARAIGHAREAIALERSRAPARRT